MNAHLLSDHRDFIRVTVDICYLYCIYTLTFTSLSQNLKWILEHFWLQSSVICVLFYCTHWATYRGTVRIMKKSTLYVITAWRSSTVKAPSRRIWIRRVHTSDRLSTRALIRVLCRLRHHLLQRCCRLRTRRLSRLRLCPRLHRCGRHLG